MPHINISRLQFFLLVVIVLIGSHLRLQGALQGTFAYTYDIGRDLLNVSQIVDNHHISLIGPTTGLPGIFYGPWWYWILVPPYMLFSGDPKGIDAFMGLTGILTVIIGFFIGKKTYNVWLGLLIAACLGFSGALVGTASQIWNPNIAPLALIAIVFCLIQLKKEKRMSYQLIYFFSIALLAAISFDSFEIVYGSLQFISVIIFIVLFFREKLSLKNILIFLVGIFIIEIPRGFFEIRHNFLMTHVLLQNFSHLGSKSGQQWNFLTQVHNVALLFWQEWTSTIFQQPIVAMILLIFTFGFCIFSLRQKIFTKNVRLVVFFCLTYLGTYFLILPFFKGDVWAHFVVGMPVVFLLFFALTIYTCINFIKKQNMNYFRGSLVILFGFFLLMLLPQFYTNSYFFAHDPSVYNNELNVITYIYGEAKGQPFDYDVYTPPIHPYTYEYLLNWYGKKHYLPSSGSHLVFYIIEPDATHPTLRDAWIKLHNTHGTLLHQQELPGNIIVQMKKV